jgi:hypothetical protein
MNASTMTASPAPDPADLVLPPAFTGLRVPATDEAFARARALAEAEAGEAAGTLVIVEREDVLDLAVILAPGEPLASARRAFLLGMVALVDAVGTYGPPEMPITLIWPGTLMFDGARLGGGRLAWPEDCAEAAVPDWLVFSATLLVSKAQWGDPGLTPGSTALDEEGFGPDIRLPLAESFARNLMKAFAAWEEDGFSGIAARYLAHLPAAVGARAGIDGNGDALLERGGATERLALVPGLTEPDWHDSATRTVRL